MNPSGNGPRSSAGTDGLLADLVEEFTRLLHAGDPVSVESFAGRYPEQAEELRRLLPTLLALADLSGSAAEDGVTFPPGPDGERFLGRLGDFRLVREVGRGGMGVVYEAYQESLGRRVALKILPFAAALDERRLQRFKLEATAAAQLHHPHIVPVFGVGCERGVHYYAMQFIDGRTLAAAVRELRLARGPNRGGPPAPASAGGPGTAPRASEAPATEPAPSPRLAPEAATAVALAGTTLPAGGHRGADFFRTAARLGVQAAEALDHAHQLGVLHRDIKPANLLLDGRGNLWVTDFGVARLGADLGLTLSGDLPGTLRYMSPELVLGNAPPLDYRSDVYSLGVTLYELLTLEPAWTGKDREQVLRQIAFEEPRPPRSLDPSVPADLDTIVLKAMAREARDRYATARELADDLKRFLEHKPIRARRPSPAERAAKWVRRHRPLVTVTAGFLVLAVVGLTAAVALLLRERHQAEHNWAEARAATARAAEQERVARQHRYVADMRLAYAAWESADLRTLDHLLSAQAPGPGKVDLRGFEWHLLRGLAHVDALVLRGHAGAVYCVSYSPDGRTVATAGQDGTVRLWDPETGIERARLGGGAEVNWVSFAPDGRTLASGGDDGAVRVWDLATLTQRKELRAHEGEVAVVEFSPDGRTLASAGDDRRVLLWDAVRWELLAVLEGHEKRVEVVKFFADGKTLVSGSKDGAVKFWDATAPPAPGAGVLRRGPAESFDPRRGDNVPPASVGQAKLFTLALAPAGPSRDSLAVSLGGGTVGLWWGRGRAYLGHHELGTEPLGLAFSPVGETVACGGDDGRVRLRECRGDFDRQLLGHTGRVWTLAFSPDGKQLASASADGTARLWDLDRGFPARRAPSPSGNVWSLAFSPDGAELAGGSLDGTVRLWDARSGRVRADLTVPGAAVPREVAGGHGRLFPASVRSVSFSPDGAELAAGTDEGTAHVWDVRSGEHRTALTGQPHERQRVCYRPAGGPGLATGGQGIGFFATLWDPAAGRCEREFRGSGDDTTTILNFSADGAKLLTGNEAAGVVVWDAETARPLFRVPPGRGHCPWAGFSPDGSVLATVNQDGSLRLWDAATGAARSSTAVHGARSLRAGAFSADGKTVVTAGSGTGLTFWHVATGQELFTLLSGRSFDAVALSPDGRHLAAVLPHAFERCAVRLWDAGPATGARPGRAAATAAGRHE